MSGYPQRPLFTYEEAKVLDECAWNSTMYRGLPLGILFSGGTYAAIDQGYFDPKPIGMYPLMFVAGIIGFSIGKRSYANVCWQKYLDIPDEKHGALFHAIKNAKTGAVVIVTSPEGLYTFKKA